MEKSELRKVTLAKLKRLTKREKIIIETRLMEKFIQSEQWENANTIGITISQGVEWNTEPIIEKAWKDGKKIAVPKCFSNKQMSFFQLDHFHQLEKGLYDIPEPNAKKTKKLEKEELNLLVVPGVVYDQKGYRIGFGGGYYDRFLVDFPNETMSLASHLQIINRLPVESFDIPVRHIITEDTIYQPYKKR